MAASLIDPFQRRITYLRISVTDRCNFRCVYCMAEDMHFLPRQQILSLEEIAFIARQSVALGVEKIRITGGEPLVRNNVLWLFQELGKLAGLQELTLTTNGTHLAKMAEPLRDAGVKRINISLDSLRPERFRALTRTGELDSVLAGIEASRTAGFERIKLNAVILKGRNDDEVLDLVEFARDQGLDLAFIEEMPLGQISHHDRAESFCSSEDIRALIQTRYPLAATASTTGGPARYYQIPGNPQRIGFISPHSHNFCATCNRVRLTAEGRLLLCLGNEHSVDLRDLVRQFPGDDQRLQQTLIKAMALKPERHHFDLKEQPQILRFMNATGG